MEDNILMLQNTIDNKISNQIKDQINSVDKEEIAEEAKLISRIEEYTKIILGMEEVKDVLLVDLEDEKEEKENKKTDQKKKEQKQTTTKDINVKQEINLSERANDMHDLRKWLEQTFLLNLLKWL